MYSSRMPTVCVSQHALGRGVYPGMHWAGGVYPSMHWAGGVCPGGVYPCMHWGQPPPEQNDRQV